MNSCTVRIHSNTFTSFLKKGADGHVYLVAEHTSDTGLAATRFSVISRKDEIDDASNIWSDGSKPIPPYGYTYLSATEADPNTPAIIKVWLSSKPAGDGCTGSLNGEREGPDLYLCWTHEVKAK